MESFIMPKKLATPITTAAESAIYAYLESHLYLVQTGLVSSELAANALLTFVSVLGNKGVSAALETVKNFQKRYRVALGCREMMECVVWDASDDARQEDFTTM
jgi:hypothetical protein